MLYTITLNEAAAVLNYKDLRSAQKWCKRHNVKVFSESQTKKKYLIRTQFEYARQEKFINYLKERYKANWLDAFKAHMNLPDLAGFMEKFNNGAYTA